MIFERDDVMLSIIQSIIANTLTALYQPFFASLVMTLLIMLCLVLTRDRGYSTLRETVVFLLKRLISEFKTNKRYWKEALLVFYTVMILFRTLFNRNMWANPVSNVIGIWGFRTVNYAGEMVLTTEVPENLALFIPFTILLLWTYRDKILNNDKKDNPGISLPNVLWQSTKIVFLFSFTIEMLQLFLRLGTWQLSDLFFNTLGGFIGGLIYWIGYKVKHRGSGL